MNRRDFLHYAGATSILALVFQQTGWPTMTLPDAAQWQLTDSQWRERLTPEQYRVLRGHGTERAGTSPLNTEHRTGVFHCAGCGLELFASAHKYDSGTGWPSFFDLQWPAHIGTAQDYKLIWPRTEVHCARCQGHLGHMFQDEPALTGLRYCINGVALSFTPAQA